MDNKQTELVEGQVVLTQAQIYQREYYKKRREEIAQNRRQRYHTDPEYRAKVVEKARAQAAERSVHRKMNPKPHRRNKPMNEREQEIVIDGEPRLVRLFAIGGLARVLNRTTQTIRKWETEQLIPLAMYRDDSGRRWYTEDQVALLGRMLEKHYKGLMQFDKAAFKKELEQEWKAMPEGVVIYK